MPSKLLSLWLAWVIEFPQQISMTECVWGKPNFVLSKQLSQVVLCLFQSALMHENNLQTYLYSVCFFFMFIYTLFMCMHMNASTILISYKEGCCLKTCALETFPINGSSVP